VISRWFSFFAINLRGNSLRFLHSIAEERDRTAGLDILDVNIYIYTIDLRYRAKTFNTGGWAMTFDELEKQLRSMVAAARNSRLPTLRELTGRFGVPRPWVHNLIHRLRDEGTLEVRRKGGITIRQNNEHLPRRATSAPPEEKLYRRLRARLASGVYRTGQPLPKTAFLANTEHVGTRIVGRVYRRLLHDGLAHANGRSLYAGPPDSADDIGMVRHTKCVLVVQSHEATWDELSISWWALPFTQSFMREMSLYGVEPRTVLMNQGPGPSGAAVPSGRAEIAHLVNSLGERLLGVFVVNMCWMYQAKPTQEVLETMRWLCGFGKPVVSFDHLGNAHERWIEPALQAVLDEALLWPELHKQHVRCTIDVCDIVRTAASALHTNGHRLVGYPMPGKVPPWMSGRRRLFRLVGSELNPPIAMVDKAGCPPLFSPGPGMRIRDVLGILRPMHEPFAHAMREVVAGMGRESARISALAGDQKDLIHLTAHLGAFMIQPGLTAIVAPNDELARRFYPWFAAAKIRVPEDCTLLSFDDRQEKTYPYTISSINFGFDNLGYTAFHILLGDIPIAADKYLSVTAKSRINHYATIGPAHRRRD